MVRVWVAAGVRLGWSVDLLVGVMVDSTVGFSVASLSIEWFVQPIRLHNIKMKNQTIGLVIKNCLVNEKNRVMKSSGKSIPSSAGIFYKINEGFFLRREFLWYYSE